jgi:hypothetical protein
MVATSRWSSNIPVVIAVFGKFPAGASSCQTLFGATASATGSVSWPFRLAALRWTELLNGGFEQTVIVAVVNVQRTTEYPARCFNKIGSHFWTSAGCNDGTTTLPEAKS